MRIARRGRRGPATLALVTALGVIASCSDGGKATVDTEVLPPPFTYVAVGASETVGVGAGEPATEA